MGLVLSREPKSPEAGATPASTPGWLLTTLPAAVPAETARLARAAFRRGNPYLTLRDTLGPLFADTTFADLYAHQGPSGHSPARLAVITLLQFQEDLSDEETAEAVRSRLDWKYLLALPADDAGFDASVLAEFRSSRAIQSR